MVAVTLSPVAEPPRLSWGGSILAAALTTLARPATWPVALAAFLVRGGVVALVLPVVVLPTPTGLANALASFLTSTLLGRVSTGTVLLVAVVCALVGALVVVGGLVAAWLDASLIRDAATDDELGELRRYPPDRSGIAWRGLAVRLLAYLPLAVALGWGIGRIVGAAYAELILPDDLARPLALRVLARVPDVAAWIGLSWIFGEVVGGLALRHLVLDGRSIAGALRGALGDLIQRPLPSIATTLVTDVALAVVAALGLLGSAIAAERLRMTVGVPGAEPDVVLGLLLFAGVWSATLLSIGTLTAFRSAAWTFELARRGTIGASDPDLPGDWATVEGSGTL